MKKKKLRLIIIGVLAVVVIASAWFGYREMSRPTTPVIAIENNIVSWSSTGRGDITAGRFIRQYEIRLVVANETFTTIVDGATEVGAVMNYDLTTFDLDNTQFTTANAEVSVRTIRNLDTGTRFSNWSNTVEWIQD